MKFTQYGSYPDFFLLTLFLYMMNLSLNNTLSGTSYVRYFCIDDLNGLLNAYKQPPFTFRCLFTKILANTDFAESQMS